MMLGSGCPFGHGSSASAAPPAAGAGESSSSPSGTEASPASAPPRILSLLGFETTRGGATFLRPTAELSDAAAATAATATESVAVPATAVAPATTAPAATTTGATQPLCHYSTYLQIPQLLSLQDGPARSKPGGAGMMHHEENVFVMVHQNFEVWFKLILVDLEACRGLLLGLDGAGIDALRVHQRLSATLQYLRRVDLTLQHATGGFAIMETMHPFDFLEFRDYLMPASGFQSVNFRRMERLLGQKDDTRANVNGATVFSYLMPDEQGALAAERQQPDLATVVNRVLQRIEVPENFIETFLAAARSILEQQQYDIVKLPRDDAQAAKLINGGVANLRTILDDPVAGCEGLVLSTPEAHEEFRRSVIAALFVVQYRHEPKYCELAGLIEQLVAVEEALLLWRTRHLHMAERMIGRRVGTGGSSGVGYLDVTRRYRIFHALWLVRRLGIRTSALPPLASYNMTSDTAIFAAADAVASS